MREICSTESVFRIPYVPPESKIKEVVPGRVLCQSGGLTIESYTLEEAVTIQQNTNPI